MKYPLFSHTYSVTLCTLHDIMPSTLMYFGSSLAQAQDKDHFGDAEGVKKEFAESETLGYTLGVR